MLLFPVIYIVSFIQGFLQLVKKRVEGFLLFTIVGLPLYINALSVTFMYGFAGMVPVMQSFKEVSVLLGCWVVGTRIRRNPRLHRIDLMILAFFLYTFLYALLPIGSYGIGARFLALKNLSFFPLIYFIGRFCDVQHINIRKTFSYICLVGIIAAVVVMGERALYVHLHTFTGFSEYNFYFFNGEVSGNYGLLWTFETESGAKRFGSIFSNPLDLASATVLCLSAVLALITYKNKKIQVRPTDFEIIGLAATLVCIVLAASRASFASYFMLVYVYGWITHNRSIIRYFHVFSLLAVSYVLFMLEGDLYDFIVNTITFRNASSLGHVLEWLDGINAMAARPLGMGLGESGRVSMTMKENIGGENQLIIIGVQTGVLAMLLYLAIYIQLIRTGLREMRTSSGKEWKVMLAVVLIKIGLFIPMFTAYLDSYIYLSYISWFMCGYMINLIQARPLPVPTNNAVPIITG